MTVKVDITQSMTLRLAEEAQREGVSIDEIVLRTIHEKFPAGTGENAQALRLIEQWISEAPTTPDAISYAEEDLRQFKLSVSATREGSGARRVYPGVK